MRERHFTPICADLKPERKFAAYPGTERYRLAEDIEALSLADLAGALQAIAGGWPGVRPRDT